MDVYDPACPTEDDLPFEEIDLSQVPLPPMLPLQGEVHGRNASSLPSELEREDKRKGRKKKRRKKRNEDRLQPEEAEDKEDDETGDQCPVLESAEPVFNEDIDDIPVLVPALATDSDDSAMVDLSERDPPVLIKPEPSSAVTSSSEVPATITSSAPTNQPGKLHFKLTPDPSSGKAKVSFQLKKSVKSTFHAAEDDDEEKEQVVEEEVKDIVEKTAAGEYIPTRFKVSKKHEIYRPSLVEPSINIVFPSTMISSGAASSSTAVQVSKSSVNQSAVGKLHKVSEESRLALADDAAGVKDSKMNESIKSERETRYNRSEEDNKAAEKNQGLVDSPRELRRSERRDKKMEESSIEKNESSSRSTRRSSRGADRDVERHGSLRLSYSRREQNESKYKEQEDKSRKAELVETNEKWRSSRSKRSESDMRKEEKRSVDRKHHDDDSKHHNHERSPKRDKNASPSNTGGRRTRSSHRNRSLSKEKDNKTDPSSDPLETDASKIASNQEMTADRLTEESLVVNESCDRITESDTVTHQDLSLADSQVIEDVTTVELDEKHPHIQKIVIRRSLESNDFEIARKDLDENISSEDSHTNEKSIVLEDSHTHEKSIVSEKIPADERDSTLSGSHNETLDLPGKERYRTKEQVEEFETIGSSEPHAQKRTNREEDSPRPISPQVEHTMKSDKEMAGQEPQAKMLCSSEPEDVHKESSQMNKFHSLPVTRSDNVVSETLLNNDIQIAQSQEVPPESPISPRTSLPISESEYLSISTTCAGEIQPLPDNSSQIVESQSMIESRVMNVAGLNNLQEISSDITESKELLKKITCVDDLSKLPERSSHNEESQRLSEKGSLIEESQKFSKRSKHIEDSEKLPARAKHIEESEKLPAISNFGDESEKLPTRSKHIKESDKLPTRSKHIEESEKLSTRSKHIEESEKLSTRSKHIEESDKLPTRSKHIEESDKLPTRSKHIEESEKLSTRSKHIEESDKLSISGKQNIEESEKMSTRSKYVDESEKLPARSKYIEESDKLHAVSKQIEESEKLSTRSKWRNEGSDKLPERNSRVYESQKLLERNCRSYESQKFHGRKSHTSEDVAESRESSERSSYISEKQRFQEKSLRSSERRNLYNKRSASPESPRFRGRKSFAADSEKSFKKSTSKDGAQKRSERHSYVSESALLPEQVLVDVSALPGKSKWEMDDYDDDDEIPGDGVSVIEDRHSVKDFRLMDVSRKWPAQRDSIPRQCLRSQVVKSSSNEDVSLDHKRHTDKKKDKTEKKLKKKRKHERGSSIDNAEPAKATEDTDVVKGKEESSRFDNSKIINYLKEYSKKEEKTSKAKTEIDSVKLVAYLKEYSGKMVAESSMHNASDSEGGPTAKEDVPQKRNTKDDSNRAADQDHAEDFSQREGVSDKQKDRSDSDSVGAKIKKAEFEKLEQKGAKDESDIVSHCSRSSSNESNQKEKNAERLPKKKDESFAASKEKRGRSSSSEKSGESASKSSQRSRDRRDRSDSVDRSRKSKRQIGSADRQDDKWRIRRRSRSRSPAWRSRDRRNRSRSLSQDKRSDRRNKSNSPSQDRRNDRRNKSKSPSQDRRSDRRNKSKSPSQDKRSDRRNKSKSPSQDRSDRRNKSKSPSQDRRSDRKNRSRSPSQDRRNNQRNRSWSRSREQNYSYRSYRSPGRDSYNRTRRDKRERRGRSRSDSNDRNSTKRHRSSEGSPSKSNKYRKKSKSPDKKGKDSSLGAKVDADRKSDIEQKVKLEVQPPVNLTSILIPDEIPIPHEGKKCTSDRVEEEVKGAKEISSTDKLQNESVKLSKKDKDEIKSVVNYSKDLEISAEASIPEQAEAVEKLILSKMENISVTVNPATLASGKDRQIKFSILGASKKLQSVLISGMPVDDDEEGSDDNEEPLGKDILKSSVITADGALNESDKAGSFVNMSDRKPVEEDKPVISSMELTDESQNQDKEGKLPASSPANIDDVNDSKLLGNKEDITDDWVESPQKITASGDKEIPIPSASPKRLKFKYIPLWEMEETERRPVFEEVAKKTETSFGLALGYGSGSSDYEDDEDSVTKQGVPGDDCSVKINESDKLDVRKDKGQIEIQKSSNIEEPAEPAENLRLDAKLQTSSEESAPKLDVIDEPLIQHKIQMEAKEECPVSQSTELHSEKLDNAKVPSEVEKEAYSPSHPSIEDTDDDFDASATDSQQLVSVDDSRPVSKLVSGSVNMTLSDVKGVSPELAVSDSVVSNVSASSTSEPATSGNLSVPEIAAPILASVLGNISSVNIASIPLPRMPPAPQIPHIPLPVNPPSGTVPSAAVLTSLIRQPFSGLRMPLSHASLVAPPLSVPHPVPPPTPHPVPPPAPHSVPHPTPHPVPPPAPHPVPPPAPHPVPPPAPHSVPPPAPHPVPHLAGISEIQFTNIPLSVSSAPRPVPPPPQLSAASSLPGIAFDVPRLSQVPRLGQPSVGIAAMQGVVPPTGVSSQVSGIQGRFQGVSMSGMMDVAPVPAPGSTLPGVSSQVSGIQGRFQGVSMTGMMDVAPVPAPGSTLPGVSSQVSGIQGRFQGVSMTGMMDVAPGGTLSSVQPVPPPGVGAVLAGTLPSLGTTLGGTIPLPGSSPVRTLPVSTMSSNQALPGGLLPLTGASPTVFPGLTLAGTIPSNNTLSTIMFQRNTLASLSTDSQSASPSLVTVESPANAVQMPHCHIVTVDSATSYTPPVRFRINRFHQSPVTQALPPPSIAIPIASTLGSSISTTISSSVPFIPALTSVQQHVPSAYTSLQSGDTKLFATAPTPPQKPTTEQPVTTTHLKRPKISSILAQPKIADPSLKIEVKMALSVSPKPSSAIVKPELARTTDLPAEASSSSEKQHPHANDSVVEKANADITIAFDSHIQKSSKNVLATREEKTICSDSEGINCSAEPTQLPTQSSERDIQTSHTAISPATHVASQNVSFSAQSKVRESIPLPEEVTSSMDSQLTPGASPQPSQKPLLPRPPSSPPKQPPLPPNAPESNSTATSEAFSKGQIASLSQSDNKKRFSQSPLSIGMLPKVQITQSPLAAGPLPKLPPEPEENNNAAALAKRKVSSPIATDTKSTTLSQAAKQKKVESKSTSKVHFVFKSKTVVQKTLIPAFDDEESDDNEGEPQTSSSETSQSEKNLMSGLAGDKKLIPHSPTSPVVAGSAAAAVAAETEKRVPEKEILSKDITKGKQNKSKFVSLTDIEAFPVQVITSSRKEEDTAAASWPEFAVAKKRKDEESGSDGKRSRDRDDRKKSKRYSHEREKDDQDHRRKKNKYLKEEDKKYSSHKSGGSRSDNEDNDDYNSGIKIKKEKEDSYEDSWSGGQDNKSSDQKKGHDDDEDRRKNRDRDSSSYSKRKNKYDDGESDYKRKGRDTKSDKFSRRRDDRDDDYTRRRYDDSGRNRHTERGRSRDRSWERDRSRERDKIDKSSSKSSGKRHHRSREESHSRSRSKSPSRRRGQGRDNSRDRYDRHRDRDRSRSRSHSHERSSSSSARRRDSKTFKEELLEELTKPSLKADPKDDLFKVTVIGSSNQTYVPEYQPDPSYPSVSDSSMYPLSHHTAEMSGGYPGHDFNLAAHYPPSYEHQEFTSHWQGQPAHTTYNQMLPPQNQDIQGQYPPMPPDQVAAPHPHPYPFQIPHHFPPPNYSNNQILTDPYHQVSSILHPQLPQMQHPVSGPPPPTHLHVDQHGQPIPPHYPSPSIQVQPPYTLSGPLSNFQPHIFTQETQPPVTPSDFHLHPGPRPRAPLLPTPVIASPLRTPNVLETSSFSAPNVVLSQGLKMPPEIRPPRKSRFSALEEGTFSPVKSSLVAASSSPTVGSPSTTSMITSEPTKSAVSASNEQSALPEPSFETSLLAESEFDSVDMREAKKSSQASLMKKKSSLEVNEPIVSSSGVEDSTGDTGSDSGTDSSSQRPLKVKSRWRSNSEADAVVVTSKRLSSLAKQLLDHGSTTPHDASDLSYERCTRSRTAAVASTAELDYANLPLVETPSPPSPSRKRTKSQPEIADLQEKENDDRISPEDESKDIEDEAEEDLASLVARPDFPKFEIINENIHLTERKRSKSMKRMLCDCTTCREDRSKGITACGSDCLNRMLMIECGSRCPCGDYCTNKRFQKKQYSRTVPFKAGDKGWGLRAAEDMEERGTFIMEYVGELLDYEEFVRRTRQYSKAGLIHHYFMALNADEVIDATLKGSISRFINHSCDPNCETQKWTVNGELRVGFFTRKAVKKGEELTFDYQFEHYGEAQKCYCGAENCRGYIGLVKSPTRNNRRKKKKKEIFKDELLEEDIEELSLLDGMRNKNHVLDLCRLMVRAEKVQHRMAILKILQDTTESACLRLFLDYHGLPLLWSWMADIGTADYSAQTQELKLLMLSVLKSLPITNKTALKESKIPDVVERWAVAAVVAARKPPPPPPPATTATTLVTVSTQVADSVANTTTLADNEAIAVSAPVTSIYEAASAVDDTEKVPVVEPEATTSSESSPPASPPPLLPSLNTVTPVSILASAKDSRDAKRKRRVTFAEMHVESTFSPDPLEDMDENDDISSSTQGIGDTDGLEGEAADRLLQSDDSLSTNVADSTSNSGTASDTDNSDTEALIKDPLASLAAECISLWSSLKEVFKIPKRERVEERKRTEMELDVLSKKDPGTSDPYAKWKRSKVMRLSRKRALEDDDRKSNAPKMSKEERRQLFEAQVKKEDEMAAQAYAEEYQRQQEAYVLHQQRLLDDPQYFYFHQQQQGDNSFAGLDPSMIPHEGLQDPLTGQPIPNETLIDPNTGQPVTDPNIGQPVIDHNIVQPLMHHPPHIDPNTGQHVLHHIDPQTGQPVQHIDPLAGQFGQHIDQLTGQHIDPLTGQHIDPLTGQPIHQIDTLTGQPIMSQIDPMTGHLLQHPMEPLMPHPDLQHVQFDPSIEPPRQHQHPVIGQIAPLNFQQQQQPQPQHVPAPPQNSNLLEIDFEEEVPPPPSPPTVPVTKLPPNWKTAKDSEGRVYYYHAFTRQTQWEMPNWEYNDDDSDDMDLDPIPVDEVIKAKKKTTTAAADTSSEVARKIKDQFRSKMSNFIVTYLNPYRKQDCKIGRIVSTDDFKHLARKLTHHVMSKELKHCRHVEDLEVNENVKAKAKDYVRKYMSKFGTTFKKTSSPHPDDPMT